MTSTANFLDDWKSLMITSDKWFIKSDCNITLRAYESSQWSKYIFAKDESIKRQIGEINMDNINYSISNGNFKLINYVNMNNRYDFLGFKATFKITYNNKNFYINLIVDDSLNPNRWNNIGITNSDYDDMYIGVSYEYARTFKELLAFNT